MVDLGSDDPITCAHFVRTTWLEDIRLAAGEPLCYLEIGCHKGLSLIEVFRQFLTHPGSRATAVDLFPDPEVHAEFLRNIDEAGLRDRVEVLRGDSRQLCRSLPSAAFDLVLVDGNHVGHFALTDMVSTWACLKPGGTMVVDDYGCARTVDYYRRRTAMPLDLRPQGAVCAFLSQYTNELELLHVGQQVLLRKNRHTVTEVFGEREIHTTSYLTAECYYDWGSGRIANAETKETKNVTGALRLALELLLKARTRHLAVTARHAPYRRALALFLSRLGLIRRSDDRAEFALPLCERTCESAWGGEGARRAMASIHFLGASGTVTGSKYVVEAHGKRLLVDAGLFQGKKELRLRNREPMPVLPSSLDAVVLTHAHIDHSGYLPVVVRDGCRGRIIATHATRDLCGLLLPDSGRLQEEEAETANQGGYSKHKPALPLYTEDEAHRAVGRIEGATYEKPIALWPGLTVTFRPAGHILGSATVQIDIDEPGKPHERLLMSGDLGRYHAPVIPDPMPVAEATTLLIECTYGDRTHGPTPPKDALADAICEAADRKGAIIIPSFAVGRAQELLYYLRELENEGRIPVLDVFVDSPMAVDATPIYAKHHQEHDEAMQRLLLDGARPFHTQRIRFTRSVAESKSINNVQRCIIISASGMATGGRVLHHLGLRLPSSANTVLFVGYQSEGTRGRLLQDGASELKMQGRYVPVRAAVRTVGGFSAHADAKEAMRWLDGFKAPPRRIFCVHGEGPALAAMQQRIAGRGPGWSARIPAHGDFVTLD